MISTEVKSSNVKSNLGHVFNYDPKTSGGLRYCINSSLLKFILYEEPDHDGLGHFKEI